MVTSFVSIAAAIVVLGLLIFVHELGHFLAAKRAGVGVLKFSLGFGPSLVSRRVGETEYCLSAIPLGGFVKMVGDESDEDFDPTTVAAPNAFAGKTIGQRTLIVVAGPMFNLLFAALVFSLLYMAGVPERTSSVGEVTAGMPAAEAGIRTDDDIVAVAGQEISRWDELSAAIRASEGRELEITVLRDGQRLALRLTPKQIEGRTAFGEPEPIWAIGVAPSGKLVTERLNPVAAVARGIWQTVDFCRITLLAIVKLFQKVVPTSTLGGPITIMQMAGEQAHQGLSSLLWFMAVLSINLGVLNLLPVPILDGGHLVFLGIEKILGHPLGVRQREIAQQMGMLVLISLMGVALYNDVHRLVTG